MKSSPLSRPRVGLIGISGYARIYYDLVKELHDSGALELVGAVVINPAEEPGLVAELKHRGVSIFASYEDMLSTHSGRLDICLIPTGIPWHARMTVAALQMGANVLVEKPLAGSRADVQAIRDAERETGRFVAVGFQDIYAEEAMWLKERLCAGVIGKVQSIRFVGLWPRSTSYFERNQWAGRLSAQGAAVLDSPFNNAFAHFVNLSLFFAGPKLRNSANAMVETAELFRANKIESFDTGVVRARSPEGVSFWFGVSHDCLTTREPEIYIEGSKGRAEWLHEQHCRITPVGEPAEERALPPTSETRRAMFMALLARWRDPSAPICGTEMAAHHTGLIEDIHQRGVIQPFTSGQIDWQPHPDTSGSIPVVSGLEAAMDRALNSRSTLREAGFGVEAGIAP